MEYYEMTVLVGIPNMSAERNEIIKFKSLFMAEYYGRHYMECADVLKVEVVDQTTGEIMMTMDKRTNEYYFAK